VPPGTACMCTPQDAALGSQGPPSGFKSALQPERGEKRGQRAPGVAVAVGAGC
jgi:hypothetical protein